MIEPGAGPADPIAPLAPTLEATAAAFVKEHRLPGAAVGVVHGDRLVWSAGVGFADIAARRAPDDTTLYRVASITKTFTGTAILQLRDEGLLHLDDPLVHHLPELRGASSPFGAIETVTIRRLLSHESGLQGEPPGTDWSLSRYEGVAERNLARVAEIGTTIPPNVQQKYSNLGYQLLGEVAARLSGRDYPGYVRERILEPLGMSGSGFEPLDEVKGGRLATGYAARFLSDELPKAATPPIVWAEGGLVSSVADLARWLSFQFLTHAAPREGAQVLAGESLREMHRPRYLGDEAWTEAWAISWYAIRRNDVIWVQHSGALPGFITNVCFDPVTRVGAIALCNGIGPAPDLGMTLGGLAREAVVKAAPAIEPPATMPAAYADLLGIYVDTEDGTVATCQWRDGELMLVDLGRDDWRPTLRPTEEPDVFVVAPGDRQSGERVTFRRRPDGRVASVLVSVFSLVRYDPVDVA